MPPGPPVEEWAWARGTRIPGAQRVALRALFVAAFRSARGVAYTDQALTALFEQDLAEAAAVAWLARLVDGVPVALLTAAIDAPRARCHLRILAVRPGHQSSGHGPALLMRLLVGLGDATVVWGDVRRGNAAARRFYRGLGFTRRSQPDPLLRETHVRLAATVATLRARLTTVRW